MAKGKIAAFILLSVATAIVLICNASAECATCGAGGAQQDVLNNEWAAFLGNGNSSSAQVYTSTDGLISPKTSRQNNPSLNANANGDSYSKTESIEDEKSTSTIKNDPQRSQIFSSVLVPIGDVSNDCTLLDISPNATERIPGSIAIPYTDFLNGTVLKPVPELAKILGDAGISNETCLIIYGECQPCGGGPSAATYVYWIMKYLGHKNVKLMDGSIDDWVAAKLPTVTEAQALPSKNYVPTLNANLLATYDYVHSKKATIVDARTAKEVEAGSIPDAVNIPYDSVLDGKKIKNEADLQELFAKLPKNEPVVVYTNTGVKASMVWFALSLLGYDARVYSWQDWLSQQPRLNINLLEATAQPNPAKTGDVIQITVVFAEENKSISRVKKTTTNNETVLTIKGCATCGFGSPQGFADLSNSGGVVQIGATSQAQKSAADSGFKVTAVVKTQSGAVVNPNIIMKRVSGDTFSGIWNANVAAGVYKVDIIASIDDVTKSFPAALQIEVTSTSKFKNLGN